MPFPRNDHNMEESAEALRAANLIPRAPRAYTVASEAVHSSLSFDAC
jgi:hypothetical protein